MTKKRVAKLVIVDNQDKYLLLTRDNHPVFGDSSDLPGGTLEEGEALQQCMLREVYEEIGLKLKPNQTEQIYLGSEYSKNGTLYALYLANLRPRPKVTLSWEHSTFNWLGLDDFIEQAKESKDTFMHMTADVMAKRSVN